LIADFTISAHITGISPWRPGQQQIFFLKLGRGLLHVTMAGLRRWKGMSSATGIRFIYCEMERPGNLPSYPPKQHYRRCKGKEQRKTFRLGHHLAKQVLYPLSNSQGRVE